MNNLIRWSTPINTTVRWRGKGLEIPQMHDHRQPVHKNNPQTTEYTFVTPEGEPVNLTAYTHAKLRVKRYGDATYTDIAAAFGDFKEDGVVTCAAVRFATVGLWDIQFYLLDDNAVPLYGDICELRVVQNVADLGTSQLPEY